jgi:hypothetical protein
LSRATTIFTSSHCLSARYKDDQTKSKRALRLPSQAAAPALARLDGPLSERRRRNIAWTLDIAAWHKRQLCLIAVDDARIVAFARAYVDAAAGVKAGEIEDGSPCPSQEMRVIDPDGYVLMIAQIE